MHDLSLQLLAASGLLTILLWIPYILARALTWGLPTFLHNYPPNYPKHEPQPPLWAARAKRAHLNMVETMPAFIAVMLSAILMLSEEAAISEINHWAAIFLVTRIIYTFIYILGIPYLRTPTYLISWFSILMIGFIVLV